MRLLRILAPVACLVAVVVTRPAPFAALFAAAGADDGIFCRLMLDPHDQFTRVVPPQTNSLVQSGAVLAAAEEAIGELQ